MSQPRIGSMFTGYCGLDWAAQAVFGGEVVWVSDISPGAVKLLAHHHPDTPNLGDVSEVDWSAVHPVDILTAGFPCTDISNAGGKAGIEGKASGLWSEVVRAIRVLRPGLVVLENVSAILVRGLATVVADLAALGYDVRWTCVQAAEVGAPHRRERWFAVAYPAGNPESGGRDEPPVAGGGDEPEGTLGGSDLDASNAYSEGHEGREPTGGRFLSARSPSFVGEGWAQPAGECGGSDVALRSGAPADTTDDGRGEGWAQPGSATPAPRATDWGPYAAAIERWEVAQGRPAPVPVVGGRNGSRVLNPAFTEWVMGVPEGWVTSVPGLSRVAMLHLLGNGVVWQQGAAALEWLVSW